MPSSILRTSSRPAGRSAPDAITRTPGSARRPAIRSMPSSSVPSRRRAAARADAPVSGRRRPGGRPRRSRRRSGSGSRPYGTSSGPAPRSRPRDRRAPRPGIGRVTVMSAVRDPAARAACSAAFVAVVAPSCETPMTRPRRGVQGQLEGLGRDRTRWPPLRNSERRIAATAWAAWSDVPHPVTMTGLPAPMASATSRASSAAAPAGSARRTMSRSAMAGSAAIMSVMWYGGPSRQLGWELEAHGSGGPGSGASGSKVGAVMSA